MFTDRSSLIQRNPLQRNYGVAVTDVTGDGSSDLFVAGYGGRNLIYRRTQGGFVEIPVQSLADRSRQAIGVGAADVDGDGREEIYVLNTDTFAGRKRFADRLFDARDGEWVNLFDDPANEAVRNLTAGRSVACIDRMGTGTYGFFVANYGGPMRLYEMNDDGALEDVAAEAGLDLTTGGRGVVSLPLVSRWMDLMCVNERGPNFLFENQGDGTFQEVAARRGVSDRYEHGRGIDVIDTGMGERFGLVYGNWKGRHRLFEPQSEGSFREVTPDGLARPSPVRSVIAADFDNDGREEVFFNNLGAPNRLFGWRDGAWTVLDAGDAREPEGLGTGAAVADFDGDGRLELVVAHGETTAQPLTLYESPATDHHYLRIRPETAAGAPARGAVVTCTAGGHTQRRNIDAGSAYLCQMEPVAHFGLGRETAVEEVRVAWPDGRERRLDISAADQEVVAAHPDA